MDDFLHTTSFSTSSIDIIKALNIKLKVIHLESWSGFLLPHIQHWAASNQLNIKNSEC